MLIFFFPKAMHSVSLKESKLRQDNLDLEIRKKLKEQKQKKLQVIKEENKTEEGVNDESCVVSLPREL